MVADVFIGRARLFFLLAEVVLVPLLLLLFLRLYHLFEFRLLRRIALPPPVVKRLHFFRR